MDTDDIEPWLWHFGHQLPVDRQGEFYQAAESALGRLQCNGPGSVYRTLVELLTRLFHSADCRRRSSQWPAET